MNAIPRSLPLDEVALRLHQQELVAAFSLFALSAASVDGTLQEASALAAQGLNTGVAKVLRYRPETSDFLVVSGVGWKPGVVGSATLPSGNRTPAGRALQSRRPVLANNLSFDKRFQLPPLLLDHAVQSAVSVVIGPVDDVVFGVLEVDST